MAKRALGPATWELVRAIRAHADPERAWVVGCSGGRDSLALTVAAALARPGGVRAVVVDHGLQPDSAQVAARTAAQLAGVVPTEVVRAEVGSAGGPEAAARSARYAVLSAEASRDGAEVLVGHTLDDQAETVLLGLTRGAGARALAGMAVRTRWTDPALELVRPLLGVRRETCARACEEQGLQWWDDPHNEEPAFLRSRIRTTVMPVLVEQLGEHVVESLARSAELLGDDADLLDELTADAADVSQPALDCAVVAELPAALRGRLILSWLRRHGGRDLGQVHVGAVERLVLDWHGQGPVDLPGIRVLRRDGALQIG